MKGGNFAEHIFVEVLPKPEKIFLMAKMVSDKH